jgi:hypothetical protein
VADVPIRRAQAPASTGLAHAGVCVDVCQALVRCAVQRDSAAFEVRVVSAVSWVCLLAWSWCGGRGAKRSCTRTTATQMSAVIWR